LESDEIASLAILIAMRYAFRTLAKSPGFTAVAILAIALGVGPNSAVFSIIHAVLLQPLPIGGADRVVIIWETNKARGREQVAVSPQDLLDWRREARSFTGIMPGNASPEYGFNLTGGGEPERVLGARVGVNFSEVMGVKMALGPGFSPDHGQPGGPPAALLSYQLWQRRFHSDPAIVGRSVGLDGVSYYVAGVTPPELRSIGSVDVWIANNDDLAHMARGERHYGTFARLRDGVTMAQAQAEMDAIQQRLAQRYPETNAQIGAVLLPAAGILNAVRPAFLMLAAAVGFLLLIACANVAGLLLARGAARQKEFAVRAALGASAARIVRQTLGESLILSTAGGLAGLLLAAVSLRLLRNALPDVIPRLKDMSIDATVLGFTIGASILTGVLFGILPALRLARMRVNLMLNDGGGKGSSYGGAQRGRSLLLMGEVALAVVLLVGAGLLIRSFGAIAAIDPGFRSANLLTMKLSLPDAKYADPVRRAAFARNVVRRAAALPGVRSVSTISVRPMRSYFLTLPASVRPYFIEGEPALPAAEQPSADFRVVSHDFLATMGIRLVRGRDFDSHDDTDTKRVALVNEALARRSGYDIIGKRIRIVSGAPREVVGIIPDVRLYNLEGAARPAVFVLNDQSPSSIVTLLLKTTAEPAGLAAAVRREVLAEDAELPVSDVQTMDQVIADSLLLRRLSMSMLAVFASLALLLAGVGIYGLTAYSVSRRTREIGLRMALGADRGDILTLVVGRGLLVGLAGVALGIPAAFGVAKLMRGMLYGIGPSDPVVFVCVPALLLAIAAVASYVPARRAMRVDPLVALKYE
jgi:putative ABC transport system permease protein